VPDVVNPILERIPSFRPVPAPDEVIANLGLLGKLAGRWAGKGFNLIARPDFEGHNDIFLELNLTNEELDFRTIGSAIPNRGSGQNDIELFGLHYLQQISDATDGGALHLEPGIWINVPSTTDPVETASVTRLATIPHGNALAAEGIAFTVPAPSPTRCRSPWVATCRHRGHPTASLSTTSGHRTRSAPTRCQPASPRRW
jgi:hypothetical protein